MSNPIGVITEQGYAAGQGLGYNPFNENDLKKLRDKESKDKNDKKEKEDNKYYK